jgi:photosystem II stability/assembly factor-like uncharacterized protein
MGLTWLPWGGPWNVSALSVIGTDLFALAGSLERSTDGGNSWIQTTVSGTCLATDKNTVFVGTSYDGIWYSRNLGTSWTTTTWPLEEIQAVAPHGKYLFIGYRAEASYFSDYTNGNSLRNSLEANVTAFTFIDTEVWAGTASAGIYKSVDSGVSWIRLNDSISGRVFSFSCMGDNIFAAASSGIVKTTNRGLSWSNCGQLPASPLAFAVAGTTLFAATNDGVFRSTDEGSSWDYANNGIVGSNCINIAVSDSNICAAIGQGFYHSTNNGSSWNPSPGGAVMTNAIAMIDSFLFDATDDYLYVRNVNNGSNWSEANNGLPYQTYQGQQYPVPVNLLIADGKVMFTGYTDGSIYRSTDYGSSWITVGTDPNLSLSAVTLAV